MKILMLGCKEYPFGSSRKYERKPGGGIEFHVEKLSKHLARRGHEVFIVTRKFPGQAGKEDLEKIHVYRTGFIPNVYLRTLTFNFFSLLRGLKLAKKERIDIVHCHAVLAGFFGSILSKLTGIPMVYTPHGTFAFWRLPIRKALKVFQKFPLKFAKLVIFISPLAMKELHTNNPSVMLTNGIDFEDYKKKKRSWKGVRFLFLGRLEKFKGIKFVLEAFKKLSKDFPESVLYIAGEGTMKKHVLDFVRENRMENIKFLGWVNSREILPQTDVFVLPSTEKGQPIALLEAMAAEKILITSLDYIENQKTGLKIKPETQDLYEKMLLVCKNPKKYEKLGKNAKKSIQNLSWSNVVRDFEGEYERVLVK